MTLNQLAVELVEEAGHSSLSDPDFVTRVENWIKEALSEIADKANWRYFQALDTITTGAGTAIYTLAFGAADIKAMRIQDSDDPIEYRSYEELVRAGTDLEMQGQPEIWFYSAPTIGSNVINTIQLWPVPDSSQVLEVLYHIDPTNLISGSTLPVMNYMLVLLRHRVRVNFRHDEKDYDGADRQLQYFLKELNDKLARERAKSVDTPVLETCDIPRGIRTARFDPSHYRN